MIASFALASFLTGLLIVALAIFLLFLSLIMLPLVIGAVKFALFLLAPDEKDLTDWVDPPESQKDFDV